MRRLLLVLAAAGMLVAAAAAPTVAKEAKPVKPEEIEKVKAALPEKATAKPAKPRTMLVYNKCRGFRHGSIGIGAETLKLMGGKTGAFTVTVTDDEAMLTPETLKKFDALCINNATSRIPADSPLVGVLEDYVKQGGGLVGIHAATDGRFGEVFGGCFAGHPWHEDVGVKIDDPDHPVNRAFGGEGFVIKDEIYMFKEPYSRDKVRVLLSLDMAKTKAKGKREDNDYAVSWVKQIGKGRVFYCSLGHRNEIFWNPKILQHYLDGIQFAMGDLDGPVEPAPLKASGEAAMPTAAAGGGEEEPCEAKADGEWTPLFNGKDLSGWMGDTGEAPGGNWTVEDGAITRVKAPKGTRKDYCLWTKGRYGDFVLDLEFKTEGNSGVFIRTDKPKDCVQTGIEIQVNKHTQKPNRNSAGAAYDLMAPTKDMVKDGEWNKLTVTARDNVLQVVMNGEQIIDMDLNTWDTPRQNPDGSKNKFRTALKNFKREGHIGFQDHGATVQYRNVRIKDLSKK